MNQFALKAQIQKQLAEDDGEQLDTSSSKLVSSFCIFAEIRSWKLFGVRTSVFFSGNISRGVREWCFFWIQKYL